MIPNSRSAVGRQSEMIRVFVGKPASNLWLKPGWQESGALRRVFGCSNKADADGIVRMKEGLFSVFARH